MKRFLYGIPVLCTLLILTAGFRLPSVISRVLDEQLEQEPILLDTPDISLQIPTDFFLTLKQFDLSQPQLQLTEGYQSKKEDVQKAAQDVMYQLSASNIVYTDPEVIPVLSTSQRTPEKSGIYWECTWYDGQEVDSILWLDDKSLLMTAFHGRMNRAYDVYSYIAPNENTVFPETVLLISEYCRQNYPAETIKLSRDTVAEDSYLAADSKFTLTISRERNGQEESFTISIRLKDNWIYFNM